MGDLIVITSHRRVARWARGVAHAVGTFGTQFQLTPFEERGKAQGEVGGRVAALFGVLSARDIPVTNEVRDHIQRCADPKQIDTWIRRAATASSLDEVFDSKD